MCQSVLNLCSGFRTCSKVLHSHHKVLTKFLLFPFFGMCCWKKEKHKWERFRIESWHPACSGTVDGLSPWLAGKVWAGPQPNYFHLWVQLCRVFKGIVRLHSGLPVFFFPFPCFQCGLLLNMQNYTCLVQVILSLAYIYYGCLGLGLHHLWNKISFAFLNHLWILFLPQTNPVCDREHKFTFFSLVNSLIDLARNDS